LETFNPAAERIFGYSAEEVLGKNINIFMPEDQAKKHDQYIQNYLKTGIKKVIDKKVEVIAKNKLGEYFPIEIGISEVDLKNTKFFTAVFSDITERKTMEIDLTQKLDELERFNQLVVGREIKMIELKEEINELLKKIGKEPKYKIVEDDLGMNKQGGQDARQEV
jgi:PAS domain S-box-containing protein